MGILGAFTRRFQVDEIQQVLSQIRSAYLRLMPYHSAEHGTAMRSTLYGPPSLVLLPTTMLTLKGNSMKIFLKLFWRMIEFLAWVSVNWVAFHYVTVMLSYPNDAKE